MSTTDIDKKLTEILIASTHMVVAVTLPDGTPWAVPLHIKRQEGNWFEWDSQLTSVHSQAVAAKSEVALTIFSIPLNLGFYAKATASLVSRREDGFGRYRATVSEAWINESYTKRSVTLPL